VRFGRKKTQDDGDGGTTDAAGQDLANTAEQEGAEAADPRANGPWDATEVTIEEDDESRLDLGSLLLTPHPDLELQLQVDEASGDVIAVVMAGEQGAAELRVFAAPRNGDIWDGVRASMAAEIAQLGGTATEREGPYGPELAVSMVVELEDGRRAEQPSVVRGIVGPRWLLRATLFGRPAVEYREDGDIETAVRSVVVVRGGTPVPPGDALPLTLPANARPAGPPDADGSSPVTGRAQ
jgi:hypothetical protein